MRRADPSGSHGFSLSPNPPAREVVDLHMPRGFSCNQIHTAMPRRSTRKILLSELHALYVFYSTCEDSDAAEAVLTAHLVVDTSRYLSPSRISPC
jgi:hypothetical protein